MTPRPHEMEDAFAALGFLSLAIICAACALAWWVL